MESRRFRAVGFWLALWGLAVPPLALEATERTDWGEGGRVYAVQQKAYPLKNELHAAVGVLPMDAFYKGVTFGAGYTHHFSHHFAWEVVQFLYASSVDSGLKGDLQHVFSIEPTAFREVKMLANSNVVFVPLYGKMSWLNRRVVHMEMYLTAGPGVAGYKEYVRQGASGYAEENRYHFSMNFGMGLRFFLNRSLSARLDLRDYMNFIDGSPDHAAYFSLGLSWNFRIPKFSSVDE